MLKMSVDSIVQWKYDEINTKFHYGTWVKPIKNWPFGTSLHPADFLRSTAGPQSVTFSPRIGVFEAPGPDFTMAPSKGKFKSGNIDIPTHTGSSVSSFH